ncbi:Hypothetical protein HVR_LOCUS877 [uncultured virus]|nr:Hypothetical protein HVR_LOCUS877 [uncultured virus]
MCEVLSLRTQFTFATDDYTLATILTQNVARGASIRVNVAGILVKKIDEKLNIVKIIVGPPDVNDDGYREQNSRFKDILKDNDITFTRQNIIQMLTLNVGSGVPGVYRVPFAALACAKIPILASYFGENITPNSATTYIFEVPKDLIKRAVKILKNIDYDDPENQLCINRNNV